MSDAPSALSKAGDAVKSAGKYFMIILLTAFVIMNAFLAYEASGKNFKNIEWVRIIYPQYIKEIFDDIGSSVSSGSSSSSSSSTSSTTPDTSTSESKPPSIQPSVNTNTPQNKDNAPATTKTEDIKGQDTGWSFWQIAILLIILATFIGGGVVGVNLYRKNKELEDKPSPHHAEVKHQDEIKKDNNFELIEKLTKILKEYEKLDKEIEGLSKEEKERFVALENFYEATKKLKDVENTAKQEALALFELITKTLNQEYGESKENVIFEKFEQWLKDKDSAPAEIIKKEFEVLNNYITLKKEQIDLIADSVSSDLMSDKANFKNKLIENIIKNKLKGLSPVEKYNRAIIRIDNNFGNLSDDLQKLKELEKEIEEEFNELFKEILEEGKPVNLIEINKAVITDGKERIIKILLNEIKGVKLNLNEEEKFILVNLIIETASVLENTHNYEGILQEDKNLISDVYQEYELFKKTGETQHIDSLIEKAGKLVGKYSDKTKERELYNQIIEDIEKGKLLFSELKVLIEKIKGTTLETIVKKDDEKKEEINEIVERIRPNVEEIVKLYNQRRLDLIKYKYGGSYSDDEGIEKELFSVDDNGKISIVIRERKTIIVLPPINLTRIFEDISNFTNEFEINPKSGKEFEYVRNLHKQGKRYERFILHSPAVHIKLEEEKKDVIKSYKGIITILNKSDLGFRYIEYGPYDFITYEEGEIVAKITGIYNNLIKDEKLRNLKPRILKISGSQTVDDWTYEKAGLMFSELFRKVITDEIPLENFKFEVKLTGWKEYPDSKIIAISLPDKSKTIFFPLPFIKLDKNNEGVISKLFVKLDKEGKSSEEKEYFIKIFYPALLFIENEFNNILDNNRIGKHTWSIGTIEMGEIKDYYEFMGIDQPIEEEEPKILIPTEQFEEKTAFEINDINNENQDKGFRTRGRNNYFDDDAPSAKEIEKRAEKFLENLKIAEDLSEKEFVKNKIHNKSEIEELVKSGKIELISLIELYKKIEYVEKKYNYALQILNRLYNYIKLPEEIHNIIGIRMDYIYQRIINELKILKKEISEGKNVSVRISKLEIILNAFVIQIIKSHRRYPLIDYTNKEINEIFKEYQELAKITNFKVYKLVPNTKALKKTKDGQLLAEPYLGITNDKKLDEEIFEVAHVEKTVSFGLLEETKDKSEKNKLKVYLPALVTLNLKSDLTPSKEAIEKYNQEKSKKEFLDDLHVTNVKQVWEETQDEGKLIETAEDLELNYDKITHDENNNVENEIEDKLITEKETVKLINESLENSKEIGKGSEELGEAAEISNKWISTMINLFDVNKWTSGIDKVLIGNEETNNSPQATEGFEKLEELIEEIPKSLEEEQKAIVGLEKALEEEQEQKFSPLSEEGKQMQNELEELKQFFSNEKIEETIKDIKDIEKIAFEIKKIEEKNKILEEENEKLSESSEKEEVEKLIANRRIIKENDHQIAFKKSTISSIVAHIQGVFEEIKNQNKKALRLSEKIKDRSKKSNIIFKELLKKVKGKWMSKKKMFVFSGLITASAFMLMMQSDSQKSKNENKEKPKEKKEDMKIKEDSTKNQMQEIIKDYSNQTELSPKIVVEGKQARDSIIFVHIHRDEKPALSIAKKIAEKEGIKLVTLENKNNPKEFERFGKINFNGKKYLFDPTAIYTIKGCKNTLTKYNSSYNKLQDIDKDSVASKVFGLGLEILSTIKNKKIVIAFHNTKYGISEEKNGYEKHGSVVYKSITRKGKSFFFVTDRNDFEDLRIMDYNVILQQESDVDNGSLSYWCAINKIRYINIDSEYDQDVNNALAKLIVYSSTKENKTGEVAFRAVLPENKIIPKLNPELWTKHFLTNTSYPDAKEVLSKMDIDYDSSNEVNSIFYELADLNPRDSVGLSDIEKGKVKLTLSKLPSFHKYLTTWSQRMYMPFSHMIGTLSFESGGNRKSFNPNSKASGPWQILPSTYEDYENRIIGDVKFFKKIFADAKLSQILENILEKDLADWLEMDWEKEYGISFNYFFEKFIKRYCVFGNEYECRYERLPLALLYMKSVEPYIKLNNNPQKALYDWDQSTAMFCLITWDNLFLFITKYAQSYEKSNGVGSFRIDNLETPKNLVSAGYNRGIYAVLRAWSKIVEKMPSDDKTLIDAMIQKRMPRETRKYTVANIASYFRNVLGDNSKEIPMMTSLYSIGYHSDTLKEYTSGSLANFAINHIAEFKNPNRVDFSKLSSKQRMAMNKSQVLQNGRRM